ncbi:GspE/PulE family protein [Deinococcus multiflagellatus]|uniref:GspE/PulE family protein n=1 Tax=Deinococcus multiflagellatus TaxID=1656887 RepID=UPI001CCFAE42|nr:GspE/PulE family protein [Deinococcus multiflagellatus]MBZ9714400.1 GspE/PulE family protein [Deinococcus multiflagellatus]
MLFKAGRITEEQLATAYATSKGVQQVNLRRDPPNPQLKDLLPEKLVLENHVVPYQNGPDGALVCVVATMHTTFLGAKIEDILHRDVTFVVATVSDLNAYIERTYAQHTAFATLQAESDRRTRTRPEAAPEQDTEDSAMSQLFFAVLREAKTNRVSDIHIQPTKTDTRVRLRVDGRLRDFTRIPGNLHDQFTNYLRVRGGVSNARLVKPQDAHMEVEVGGQIFNIRVNILPTVYGPKTVLRLLSSPEQIIPLDELHMTPSNRALLQWGLDHTNGILIISGPTGSGKTNTLYSITRHIDRPDINITTIENPVEIRMDTVTQVQLNPDALNPEMRLGDQEALRAVLRQDPDVILIGEMRDPETVRLGMQAAQTGHFVLATIHTNSAAEIITRLKDMNANPFDIAPSVRLLIAQRLIRCPCPDCSVVQAPPADLFDGTDIPSTTPIRVAGNNPACPRCDGHGHLGRVAIQEILPVRGLVREAIRANAAESAIVALAREHGFRTLYEDALTKLAAGLTTLSEVQTYRHGAQH